MAALAEFTASGDDIKKLKKVVLLMRGLALLAAGLVLFAAYPYGEKALVAAGLASLLLIAFAVLGGQAAWLQQRAEQRLLIQAQAVEIQRGRFTRFVLFEDMRTLKVQRRSDDSITTIVLVTQEGPLVIRGFKDMELIFGHISTRKPEEALIQIENAHWWR